MFGRAGIRVDGIRAEAIGSEQARTNHDATLTVIEALFGWTAASPQFIESITRHRSV